jgi:hypothetical protein
MKKISFTLLAILLFAATALRSSAQTEQTRQVSGFSSVASSGSFSVHVKIDGTESLKISADKAIINEIETVVKDGTLRIGFKNSFAWHRNIGKVDVYVTAKSLSGLSNSGSGSIKVDGELHGNNIDLHLSGSGSITASAKSETLNARISGSGSLALTGSTNDIKLEISGSGRLDGKGFKTRSADVRLSGSGNAYINADKNISAHISGSGSLVYSGSASITDSRTSGSGRIRREHEAA